MDNNDFLEYVEYNDIDNVIKGLNDLNVDPTFNFNISIKTALNYNYYNMFKTLIEDDRILKSANLSFLLNVAASVNNDNIVKMLVYDYNVDLIYLKLHVIIKMIQSGYIQTLRIVSSHSHVLNIIIEKSSHPIAKLVIMERLKLKTAKELNLAINIM
jgi:hypothetical protein